MISYGLVQNGENPKAIKIYKMKNIKIIYISGFVMYDNYLSNLLLFIQIKIIEYISPDKTKYLDKSQHCYG